MTLETFFANFDRFADAPNAVAKMRELVLELAVRGKLVEPTAFHEKHPAWQTFHNEFSESKSSRNPDSSSPFEIPEHWLWSALDVVADCRAAAKVSPNAIEADDWVLDLEDIDGAAGQIIQFATFAERSSLSTKAAFEPGDVLYGKLRPYLNKVVIAPKAGFCTTEIIPLRPAAFLSPEFLRYYLRSQTFLSYTAEKNYGMKMPRLGTKDLEAADIPVPPPAEQKRIVAKVDELMALCDRLEAQQQERDTRRATLARAALARFADAPTPENLNLLFYPQPSSSSNLLPAEALAQAGHPPARRSLGEGGSSFIIHPSLFLVPPADLRKSILTLAVQGKLVPQDPNDEPVIALAEGEAPFDLPVTWQWKPLGSIGLCRTGKTPPTNDRTNYGKGFPFIGPGQITFSGSLMSSDRTLTQKGLSNSTLANADDIIMVCIGGSIGKTAICHETLGFNQQINAIRLEKDLPVYIYFAFTSSYFQEQVLARASGSATPIINKGKWEQIPIPIPPTREQHQIVEKLEKLLALVDALEAQLVTASSASANLLATAVTELTVPSNAEQGVACG